MNRKWNQASTQNWVKERSPISALEIKLSCKGASLRQGDANEGELVSQLDV
jgi:hypothetical protein